MVFTRAGLYRTAIKVKHSAVRNDSFFIALWVSTVGGGSAITPTIGGNTTPFESYVILVRRFEVNESMFVYVNQSTGSTQTAELMSMDIHRLAP